MERPAGKGSVQKAIGPVPILDGGPVGRGKSKWVKVPEAKSLVSRVTATRVFTSLSCLCLFLRKGFEEEFVCFKVSIPVSRPGN